MTIHISKTLSSKCPISCTALLFTDFMANVFDWPFSTILRKKIFVSLSLDQRSDLAVVTKIV